MIGENKCGPYDYVVQCDCNNSTDLSTGKNLCTPPYVAQVNGSFGRNRPRNMAEEAFSKYSVNDHY